MCLGKGLAGRGRMMLDDGRGAGRVKRGRGREKKTIVLTSSPNDRNGQKILTWEHLSGDLPSTSHYNLM